MKPFPVSEKSLHITQPLDLSIIQVSTFADAKATAPINRSLADVLDGIQNGEHRAAVSAVRTAFAEGGKDAADPLKLRLPSFTASGTFTRRAADALATTSGLIIADLDNIADRLAAVRAKLEADPHTLAAFTSPTGSGLKVIYRMGEGRTHAQAFADMRALVLDVTGEEIDRSGKDVSRLCFVSDDSALYRNAHALPLPPAPADLDDLRAERREKLDAEAVSALLACIPPRPEYGEWLRIASAVWDALGEVSGTAALAAWSPEEKQGEYAEKYRHRLARVKAGTLFFIASRHAPEAVAALRVSVGAADWFPAAIWGESFAAAWRAALDADTTTTRPVLAAGLLAEHLPALRGVEALRAPANLSAVRARLVALAAATVGQAFAAADVLAVACELLGVTKSVFRAAVKAHAEGERHKLALEALAELDGETGSDPLFFDGSAYWRREADGAFGKLTREDARLHLNTAGLSKTGDPSPCDLRLHELQSRNRVDYAGPLCGRPAGLFKENGLRILVTRGPAWIEGEPGNFPTIAALVADLFGRAVRDPHAETQRALFLSWLRLAREAMRTPEQHRPGQVLALVGPPDCGKSLLQSAILTPALGGRAADPGLFFIGETNFNADLWGAEHLALGDKALDVEGVQRSALRNELKRAVAEPAYPLHGKHRDALTLRPVWRLSLSANDDAESASNLPTLDAAFADKIIYLKCYAPPRPFYDADAPDGREVFAHKLRNELPAFFAAVDAFAIPANLRKARFGVKEWHHPAILDLLGEGDPLRPISDVLENWIAGWEPGESSVELPTVELFALLDAHTVGGLIRPKICSGPKHLGRNLAALATRLEWLGRLSHRTRRVGGREANRPQAVWRIDRENGL